MATILIVDDIKSNRTLLTMVLEAASYDVLVASNGKEALEQIDKCNAIISDILMPVMDGYELCKIVKSGPHKNIPFAFYTATYLSEQDERFARSLGACAFLEKPMEPDKILETVTEMLSSKTNTDSIVIDEVEYAKFHEKVLFDKLSSKIIEIQNFSKKNEQLLSELQHRTRDNLQMITSLFNLMLDENSEQNKKILDRMEPVLQVIRLVQDKIFVSHDNKIESSEIITDICNYIKIEYRDTQYLTKIFPFYLLKKDVISFGIAFIELMLVYSEHAQSIIIELKAIGDKDFRLIIKGTDKELIDDKSDDRFRVINTLLISQLKAVISMNDGVYSIIFHTP